MWVGYFHRVKHLDNIRLILIAGMQENVDDTGDLKISCGSLELRDRTAENGRTKFHKSLVTKEVKSIK